MPTWTSLSLEQTPPHPAPPHSNPEGSTDPRYSLLPFGTGAPGASLPKQGLRGLRHFSLVVPQGNPHLNPQAPPLTPADRRKKGGNAFLALFPMVVVGINSLFLSEALLVCRLVMAHKSRWAGAGARAQGQVPGKSGPPGLSQLGSVLSSGPSPSRMETAFFLALLSLAASCFGWFLATEKESPGSTLAASSFPAQG